MYLLAWKLISIMERLDEENTKRANEDKNLPAVLVFLPGIQEIVTFQKLLIENSEK